MSAIKPNCEWQRISARYSRENNSEEQKMKQKVPCPWRICQKCNKWSDANIVDHSGKRKKFTCFKCLDIKE